MIAERTPEEQNHQSATAINMSLPEENLSEPTAGTKTDALNITTLPEEASSSADSNPTAENGPSEPEKNRQPRERQHDQWEPLRAKSRAKETVQAQVIKWQRNGLEMELADELIEGHPALKAFMPNDDEAADTIRNIDLYRENVAGEASVKAAPGVKTPDIIVSHRAVLAEEANIAGHESVKKLKVGDVIEVRVNPRSRQRQCRSWPRRGCRNSPSRSRVAASSSIRMKW